MLNRRKKQFISDTFSHPLFFTIIGVLILILIAIPLVKNIKKQYAINSEIRMLDSEIKDFEAKNIELKNKFKYLESDQFANEQAKINLNYKKAGEEVVVIKTIATETPYSETVNKALASANQNNETSSADTINPVRWWRYFFY